MRWGQLGNPSSHWTIGLSNQWFFVALIVLTGFRLWLSAYLPPAEDELYYWTWAQNLQGSYFDHPPMVAVWIRISTAIFGDSMFAIRLFATLSSSLVLLFLGLIVQNKQVLGLALLTPIFLLGSVIMTPDAPLLFFWTLYFLWMLGASRTLGEWSDDPITRVYRKMPVSVLRWVLGGMLLGLGGLSKYSMALAVPCVFLILATKYRAKAWATGFFIHLVVAALVCLPVFLFNWEYDFAPFRFQWAHSMTRSGVSLKGFFDFIGSQIILLGALPFLLLPAVIGRAKEFCSEPRAQVCFHFFVFPILFFLVQAMRGHLEANWALAAYISFWPLSQRLLDYSSFRGVLRMMVALAFVVPLAVSAALLIHTVIPLKFIPPEKDRLEKMREQYSISVEAARDMPLLSGGVPIFVSSYQWASYLRYQKIAADQLYPEGRASNFTLVPKDPCSNATVVAFLDDQARPGTLSCFGNREVLKEYPLKIHGNETGKFVLVRYTK